MHDTKPRQTYVHQPRVEVRVETMPDINDPDWRELLWGVAGILAVVAMMLLCEIAAFQVLVQR